MGSKSVAMGLFFRVPPYGFEAKKPPCPASMTGVTHVRFRAPTALRVHPGDRRAGDPRQTGFGIHLPGKGREPGAPPNNLI